MGESRSLSSAVVDVHRSGMNRQSRAVNGESSAHPDIGTKERKERLRMPMTADTQQTFALPYFWMAHNRHEMGLFRGEDLFQAMYPGVHAKAETSGVADALVRRMIRGAIKMAETL